MIPRNQWKYRGLPGHFCAATKCSFRLCTDIGNVRISTVGAYYPTGREREMEEIGIDRHYETYVFKLNRDGTIKSLGEIDSEGLKHPKRGNPYGSDAKAEEMHERMCLKWARKQGKKS